MRSWLTAACLAGFWCALGGGSAAAESICGPHFMTYRHWEVADRGEGVRCVRFLNATSETFGDAAPLGRRFQFGAIWYGEGSANDGVYRHVGTLGIFAARGGGEPWIEYLRHDIFGNGEDYDSTLEMRFWENEIRFVVDGVEIGPAEMTPEARPSQILFYDEDRLDFVWTAAPEGGVAYVSPAPPMRECGQSGPAAREFTTFTPTGAAEEGVVCGYRLGLHLGRSHGEAEIYRASIFWVAAGSRDDAEYLRLLYLAGPGDFRFTSADICFEPGWRCDLINGGVMVRDVEHEVSLWSIDWPDAVDVRFQVTGALEELWGYPR